MSNLGRSGRKPLGYAAGGVSDAGGGDGEVAVAVYWPQMNTDGHRSEPGPGEAQVLAHPLPEWSRLGYEFRMPGEVRPQQRLNF
jgi:hypothetical protein